MGMGSQMMGSDCSRLWGAEPPQSAASRGWARLIFLPPSFCPTRRFGLAVRLSFVFVQCDGQGLGEPAIESAPTGSHGESNRGLHDSIPTGTFEDGFGVLGQDVADVANLRRRF